jgi:phosphatidylglycerophosphate synthase
VRTIRLEAVLGAVAPPALLAVLAATVGLGGPGWVVGLAAGWTTTALLAAARIRSGDRAILPADWVTLTRALLAAAVAGLVADAPARPVPVAALVALTSVALVLDGVDGRVARRTGTATPLGARFDGEVDAFLILVLSVLVARDLGTWVLALGLARYALLVAGWLVPWLAAPLPPRYWAKVVAAVVGVVLTVAATGRLPRPVGTVLVGAALLLLAESFGRSVVTLYRTGAGPRSRTVLRRATALVAAAVVWTVLVAPDRLDRLTPAAFARIPVEGLALVAVCLLLPRRARRVAAPVAGVALGLLTLVKVLDVGFYAALGRPFDPVLDWGNLGPAVAVVRDSIGTAGTAVALVLAGLAVVLVVAVVTAAAVRLGTVTARHRRRSAAGVGVLGTAWALCAALSLQLVPGSALASAATADLVVSQVRTAERVAQDMRRSVPSGADPYAGLPAADLLGALRGKDVVIAFVESYGQSAVQDSSFAPGVDAVLRSGTTTLADTGWSARSAFLDSPTFGALSWLAHSTLQSGLWIADQEHYQDLVRSDRFTLSDAFRKAGWRTVGFNPADTGPWPEGTSFYHYDRVYDRSDLGYRGPGFSFAPMPDQYSLAAFQRLELGPGHRPVMTEFDLVSSHAPWTPLPSMVPWDQLGDGSVFDRQPAGQPSPSAALGDPDTLRRLYGQSIRYTMSALVSWVARLHDDDLVLLLLGDHQPATEVSGDAATHAVPVSLVTRDPAVLDRIASWQWQPGLLPAPTAPLWPMDAFRDRFLDAFGTPPASRPAR